MKGVAAGFHDRVSRVEWWESREPTTGDLLDDRYELFAELGRGASGVVFRARDRATGAKVAVKVLTSRAHSHEVAQRLRLEVRAAWKVTHPAVVRIYDLIEDGKILALSMEFVHGETLESSLRASTHRTALEVMNLAYDLACGLEAAHGAGVTHRDLKPANILLRTGTRRPVITDFGVSRVAESADLAMMEKATQAKDQRFWVTKDGVLVGTPLYMAPEQLLGQGDIGPPADIFAFAIILHEFATGECPFQAKTLAGLLAARQRPPPVPLAKARPDLPRAFCEVIARCLQFDPSARTQNGSELREALRGLRQAEARAHALRRSIAAAACAAIIGASGSAGYLRYKAAQDGVPGRRSSVCQGAPGMMTAIWNPARRDTIRGAFFASGVPYADHAFGVVSAALDRYSDDWKAIFADACEAKQSEDMLDRRMSCLEQRRVELAAKVDVLTRADRASLEKAVQTAQSLAAVSDCADLTHLASRIMPPDRATRAEVERSWQELGRAKALFESGRYVEGEPVARAVAERASKLRYRPLEADAMLTLAQLLDAKGEYTPAEDRLRQALRSAQAGGVHDVAARAWIGLIKVAGVRQQHHREAHEWALDAKAHLETLPASDATLGLLLSAESDLLYQEGKFEQAVETGQEARTALERSMGSEAAAVAEVLKTIGNADADLGKTEAARADYEKARHIWQKALGPEHPAVAAAWNNLGTLQLEQESFDGALRNFRRALDIWTHSLGPDHPNVAVATTNIGEALRALGAREGAAAAFRSALAIRTRALGADHPLCASNLANLANLALDAGDLSAAYRSYEEALAIWEKRLGPKDQHVATALNGLGATLLAEKSFAGALPLYQRALDIQEEALGKDHLYLVDALAGLGQAQLGLGQHLLARERLERALKLAETHEGDRVTLADVRLALAEALWHAAADRPRARALAREARDGYLRLGKRGERGVKKARDWIAMPR